MDAAPRKYVTEFSLNMWGSFHSLVQQDAFTHPEHLKALSKYPPFHVYMICSRPRIAWVPESLIIDDASVSGTFTIQKGSTLEKHNFKVPNQLGTSDAKIICEYPHTEYEILSGSGLRIGGGKVANAMIFFNLLDADFMDLEVLYVGQSYGEGGSRVAADRLQSHSTLQGIYAEAMRRSPDKEIWILLWAFEPILLTSFDGTKPVATSEEEDTAHIQQVLRTGITEQQRINFTEAAIIRHFRPSYNATFKDTFPNPAHSTYSECYNLDLNAVNVELNTESLQSRLWSHCARPEWIHFISFGLHSADERKSMFDFA
jgi:hypothetical protein